MRPLQSVGEPAPQPPPASAGCLSEADLLVFLEGDPGTAVATRVEQHIDTCAACFELLTLLSEELDARAQPDDSSPAPAPPEPLPWQRGSYIDRFFVLDLLGVGGMGIVYAAFDPKLDRKVALKVLRGSLGGRGRDRLRREAQSLARLAHPHVIAIYDIGIQDDQDFIVMELVDGVTLKDWLAASRRPWRAVLEVMGQAGRGLLAAHRAGLVHRDFKPSNLLVERHGRARVLDFGLARAVGEAGPADAAGSAGRVAAGMASAAPDAAPAAGGSPILGALLTRTGALLGTPAYMAPEQYLGAGTDARTDQFSFCVVLYEALYGQHPFAGDTLDQLAEAITTGRVRPPPPQARVPAFVQRALQRGLHVDPAARFPSMEELLAALQRDPGVALRRVVVGIALAALFGAGLLSAHRAGRQQAAECSVDGQRLRGIWDQARKQEIQTTFLRSGKPYAEAAFGGVRAALDGYLAGWTSMHIDACRATRVRGEQSAELLDLRMQCLDARLQEVAALSSLLVDADASVIERAVQAAHQLTPLADCADARALLARVRPPREPAQRAELESLRGELAAVQGLKVTGQYAKAQPRAEALLRRAQQLGYPPLLGDALLLLAALQRQNGAYDAAEAGANAALLHAVATGDETQAFSASDLLLRLHNDRHRFAQAEASARYAEAVLAHLGGPERLVATLSFSRATLEFNRNHLPQAEREFQRAYDLWSRTLPPGAPDLHWALLGLATVAGQRGDSRRYLTLSQKLLANAEATLGSSHPTIAAIEESIGNALSGTGDPAAFPHFRRCLEIRQRSFSPPHPLFAQALANSSLELIETGRYAEATATLKRALSINERAYGHEHQSIEAMLVRLGSAYMDWGKADLAAHYLADALAIARRLFGDEDVEVAHVLKAIGEAALQRHDCKQAIVHEQTALALFKKKIGAEGAFQADTLRLLGDAYLHCGQPVQAVEVLGRAAQMYQGLSPSPDSPDLLRTRALLTKAQAARHGSEKRTK